MMKANKGKGGFRVPESYFDNLPDRMIGRMREADSPRIPGEAGFRVPQGYFEDFERRLMERLDEKPGKVRRLWPGYLGWAAAAAAAILLVVLWNPQSAEQPLDFADLAGSEIEIYLESGVDDMNTYDLAEALPLDGIALGDVLETVPSEEQIIDYLDRDTENLNELYWNGDE